MSGQCEWGEGCERDGIYVTSALEPEQLLCVEHAEEARTMGGCEHAETFPPNADGETICRACWNVIAR